MIDIVSFSGGVMKTFDTDVERAKNICTIQAGALEYQPTFGIDLKFFLQENVIFQNESFKAYLVQRLTDYGINVTQVTEGLSPLFETLGFSIGNQDAGGGLVAR